MTRTFFAPISWQQTAAVIPPFPEPTTNTSTVLSQFMLSPDFDQFFGQFFGKIHETYNASNNGNDFSTAAAAVLAAWAAKTWKSSWLSSPARSDSALMISQGTPNASATCATAPLSMSTALPAKLENSRSRVWPQPR